MNYRRLENFDILERNFENNLIVWLKSVEMIIQFYVTNDEFFSILTEIYISTDLLGRNVCLILHMKL